MKNPTALIAEDEPLLAQALEAELKRAWPALAILRTVGDGLSAVQATLELAPDVVFFDIRMPGISGLDAAMDLADSWPPAHAPHKSFPALVFVTAYDHYAVQAFEAQALDYVLKPVQPDRLKKTVERIQQALALREVRATAPADNAQTQGLYAVIAQLRGLMHGEQAVPTPPLRMLQASVGNQIHMVPVDSVLYLEAADKYLRVLTEDHEYLLRTPLKDLLAQLDPALFWQIHRGTVVRATAIDTISRDATGRMTLRVRGRTEKLVISRVYAHRFKAM